MQVDYAASEQFTMAPVGITVHLRYSKCGPQNYPKVTGPEKYFDHIYYIKTIPDAFSTHRRIEKKQPRGCFFARFADFANQNWSSVSASTPALPSTIAQRKPLACDRIWSAKKRAVAILAR